MTTKNEQTKQFTKGTWYAGCGEESWYLAVNDAKVIGRIYERANAELICALVNAAQEIGNPMAVAQNLKAMHDALKEIWAITAPLCHDKTFKIINELSGNGLSAIESDKEK